MEQTLEIKKMRKTVLGRVPLESPFYALHPVTRFTSLIVLSVIPLFIDIPEINVAYLLLLLVLFKIGKVDISSLRIYLPMIFTVALFMFTMVFLFPGEDPSYHPIRILFINSYYEPVWWTFISYWRLMAMLFGTIIYFSTNRERDTLVALRALRLPFAVSYVIGLSLRSAGMFMEDLHTIREAEQARGLDTAALSLGDKVKLYVMYIIPLMVIALRRADEISNALFAKGYTVSGKVVGGGKRADFILSHYHYRILDYILIAGLLLLFVGVIIAQYRFGLFRLEHSPLNQYFLSLLGAS